MTTSIVTSTDPTSRVIERWLASVQHEYQERVTRGAALYDETIPNWFNMINMATLDVADATHCVASQLDRARGCRRQREPGSAWYLAETRVPDDATVEGERYFGIFLERDEDWHWAEQYEAGYALLTDLWRREVVRRRVASAQAITRGIQWPQLVSV